MKPKSTRSTLLLGAALVLTVPGALAAQARSAWNDPVVLRLVERARELRASTVVDSAFRSYKAEGRGYVYFFFDRPDSDVRNLVKADQVALDLFWKAPDSTRQVIVGQRDQKLLPTDIRYHIDHLTVVQDDYGDRIRVGDGDEVAAVLHPVGPGSESVYDFLLADSLSISYAGGEVHVYEIRVRPRDLDRPGFVGTLYVDRSSGAIVRMNFSFTPASYVDPYVDHIRIALDNSLWMERYWLPYKQEVEIRREIPMLDFRLGSVIRSRFEIRGYEFNVDLPPITFLGGRVGALSPARRAAFHFDRGLFDDIEEEGLTPSPSLEEVRTQVRQVVEDRGLSGLHPLRFRLEAVSDFARYDRAEGLRVGGGLSLRPRGDLVTHLWAGYAFGRRKPSATVSLSRDVGAVEPTVEAYWDEMRDIGGYPGSTPLENTITSLSGHEDYTDPFFSRGAALTLRHGDAGGASVSFRYEEQRSARDVVSDDPADTDYRPVRTIEEGRLGSVALHAPFALPGGGDAQLNGRVGRLGSRTFGSVSADVLWDLKSPLHAWSGEVSLGGGALTSRAPAQWTYLLGGRWTLPGQDYRSFAGDRYWLARAEATVPVWAPYVSVRALGAVGATYLTAARPLPLDWVATDSDGLRGSLGGGLAFGWDALRVDVAHGVRGGGWEALFSVAREFRSWL